MANLSQQIREWALSQGEDDPLEEEQFNESQIYLRDDSDGSGAYIATWNMPWTQPTPAELQSVDSAADTRNNHEALIDGKARPISIDGQKSIADPLGTIPPNPPHQWPGYILIRNSEWEKAVRDGATPPATVTAIQAAQVLQGDWLEAEGLVVEKVRNGTYTNAADVMNAPEWP